MGNGMEALIMMALLAFMITNLVSIAIVAWFIKLTVPFYKHMNKQLKKLFSELEKEEG